MFLTATKIECNDQMKNVSYFSFPPCFPAFEFLLYDFGFSWARNKLLDSIMEKVIFSQEDYMVVKCQLYVSWLSWWKLTQQYSSKTLRIVCFRAVSNFRIFSHSVCYFPQVKIIFLFYCTSGSERLDKLLEVIKLFSRDLESKLLLYNTVCFFVFQYNK